MEIIFVRSSAMKSKRSIWSILDIHAWRNRITSISFPIQSNSIAVHIDSKSSPVSEGSSQPSSHCYLQVRTWAESPLIFVRWVWFSWWLKWDVSCRVHRVTRRSSIVFSLGWVRTMIWHSACRPSCRKCWKCPRSWTSPRAILFWLSMNWAEER